MTSKLRWFVAICLLCLSLALSWLLATENQLIWPVRNALQYRIVSWWWANLSPPRAGPPGSLSGTVRAESGEALAGAWVLLARYDGTTYHSQSDGSGHYLIRQIPAASYRPVAGKPGYASRQFGDGWGQVKIEPGQETEVEVVLRPEASRSVSPGSEFSLGEPQEASCTVPVASQGRRRVVHFSHAGSPNQPTFYYTPLEAPPAAGWPALLAIYPGPADSWECVSIPLAAAGYAVVAAGPAYTFDLEADLDELERVLAFSRAGNFPGTTGDRIALLGGSYSSLHVLRLLQRGQPVQAALLLGPPTDLFDMRRRLENGSFVPPFGLDQAFYALGFPDREPLRYWQYSGAYHISPDFPPLAVLHSRTDAVVPYQQSELLIRQLEAAGVPFESYFFDGGGHYLLAQDGDDDALQMYEITLNFLAKHLK